MAPHSSIIERLLQPSVGDMPADYAQRMLEIDFTDGELARHRFLSVNASRTEDRLLRARLLLMPPPPVFFINS